MGDTTGSEIFTNPYNGLVENANTAQTGCEAAYVYRSAGTYTATLNLYGQNGAGLTTTSVTTTITVTAFNPSGGDWYFDSVNGSDSNNGTSSATPKQTWSAVLTAVSNVANNYRINFAKGSSWTAGASGIDVSGKTLSHVRFQSYGSGAAPTINLNTANTSGYTTTNGGSSASHPQDDFVISGINFQTVSGWDSTTGASVIQITAAGNATAVVSNYYLDNCTVAQNIVTTTADHNVIDWAAVDTSPKLMVNQGLWNVNVSGPATSTHTRQGIFFSPMDWGFIVGGSFSGAGTSTTFDHHIYPLMQTHALFRYITFNAAAGKLFAINADWNSLSGGNETAQYWLLSDNHVAGPLSYHDASDASNDTQVVFSDWVTQRSNITGLANPAITFFGGQSMTFRYLRAWNNTNTLFNPNGTTTAIYQFYKNCGYYTSSAGSNYIVDIYNGGTPVYTSKQVVTDNQFNDQRTAAVTYNIGFTNQAGATINRNDTYAPNDSDAKFFGNAGVISSFAQWQTAGFDAAGSTANPNFANGPTGNFCN